jgi:hypothetical protein
MTGSSGQSSASIASDDDDDVIFVSAKSLNRVLEGSSDSTTGNAAEIALQNPKDPTYLYDILCRLAPTKHDLFYNLNLPANLDGLDTWLPPSQPASPGKNRIIAPVLLEDHWTLFVLDMVTFQTNLFTARPDSESRAETLDLVASKLEYAFWLAQGRRIFTHKYNSPLVGDDPTHALTMLDVAIRLVISSAENPICLPTEIAPSWQLCLRILYGGQRQNDELPGRRPRQELSHRSIEASHRIARTRQSG